jgi:GntR family transcriptional regulator
VGAPRYIEILDQLRERCAALAPGTKLASERALAEEFDVSTMTVRQSLARLADEGWVRRSQGSGTYVSRPTVTMGPSLTSYTEDMRRLGLEPSSRVLRFETIKPDLETVTRLELRPSEQAIVLERLRLADGEPMCHEIGVFPSRLADALGAADLTGSVHEALAEWGVAPYSTFRRVRAVVAPERECELLGLPSPSPALEISDTFADALGQPFQHVRTRYRFDRYEVLSKIDRLPGGQR